MKMRFAFILFVVQLIYNEPIWSQRPVLTDEEIVSEMVTTEMNEVFQSSDFIKKKNKKFSDVTGDMVIDITVIQSGKVATFFKVDSTIKDIDFINFMSEYILTHKFKFKLEKKKRYKIRYNITF
ncbi:MAG: hypothetical protein LRY32_04190 [Flavobacterium sp.]|jgi:hypothetical protein|nr:hypothetical protein [Flavobacterium sp.]